MAVAARGGYRTIGILGGMGPRATAHLYVRIIEKIQEATGATYDCDYPQILVNSLPAPDVVESEVDEGALTQILRSGAMTLETGGAEFIAVACNSVHAFWSEVAEAVSIPVLDLADETISAVETAGHRSVGVIGTRLTLTRVLHRERWSKASIELVEPSLSQQEAMARLILEIIGGRTPESWAGRLGAIAGKLVERGAEAVVLGCTDLSGIRLASCVPVFDASEILADATVREARVVEESML